MLRRKVIRGEGETRQRILQAAIERFAQASYDEIGLREIAAAVGVDVAYVHRSFGSKENLFREVLRAVGRLEDLWDLSPEQLPAALARRLFERPAPSAAQGADPLVLFARSLPSQKAGRIAGESLQQAFIEQLQARLGDPGAFRAAVVASLLIGVSLVRNLLQLPALTAMDRQAAEDFIASVIAGILASEGREGARPVRESSSVPG